MPHTRAHLGWLDIHGHFRPPESWEEAEQRCDMMRQNKFLISKPDIWDAKEIITYLDNAGVTMQMLSNIPKTLLELRSSNDYGTSLVLLFPSRFGLLAALPTNNQNACLSEINRMSSADGFAVMTVYNGVWLSDPALDPVWAKLNDEQAIVFVHPDANVPSPQGRPAALVEVAFDTTRTIVDMLYKGIFKRFKRIRFVVAHAGGGLAVLSGRLRLLGAESWVPNPLGLSADDIDVQLKSLYVDTAASAATGLRPAISMVGVGHCIYGSDCGVACSSIATMETNRQAVKEVAKRVVGKSDEIGMNGWELFPAAARRASSIISEEQISHSTCGIQSYKGL
jgi:predicted TIM-barrel fold metal-dependent hydrolase